MINPLLGLLFTLGLAAPTLPEKSQPEKCYATRVDVDEYLFEKYLETPKVDSNEDFTSKDPKAAALLDMPLKKYVIGGMDKDFKTTLYVALKEMDEAGLNPGITSAFRDDYRQQLITKGVKARVGNSYHGGSKHGGYGHGLAIDLVSLNGNTRTEQEAQSEKLWNWIDTFGRLLGIARPYGNHDAPHVVPITSPENYDHTRVAHAHIHRRHTRLARHIKYRRHYASHKNTARG